MRIVKKSLIAAAALALALPACSSLPAERTEPSTYRSTLDAEVIQLVETKAAMEGTQVYWINPPRKSKKD
jgi:hypothetical protein